MNRPDLSRWNQAAKLLEQVLELPTGEQDAAVDELGTKNGVHKELAALLLNSRKSSVLDASLEDVLDQLPTPDIVPNALKGAVFGNWVLGDEIGHGGMSAVYHASRIGQDFEQHAALKVLSVGHLGRDFVDSFVRERQILSDLQHAGIARLIDGGLTPEGAPYLVMQYVEGDRIDQWCRRSGTDLITIVRMILKLCQAVAYAHRHLVVHQDIKPGNVLVDEHDQPVLIDFGIARLLRSSSADRNLHAFTPHFAAPEQVAGGSITTATDVYSIGMLLQMLVGDVKIDQDLGAILSAATNEDPEQRYANARNLAEDLQAWLDKRPVRARTPTLVYRLDRFVTRYRWGVLATALITLSLIIGLGMAMWQASIAASERDMARTEEARALQVTEFLKTLFRASDPDRARGEEVSARELLDQGAYRVNRSMASTPGLKTEMLVLLGDLYRELGEQETAQPLLEQAVSLADDIDSLTLRVESRRALALHRMDLGEHDEALALANEAEALLELAGSVPGDQHSSLMQPILFSLTETGRVSEAVDRGKKILTRARQQPGLTPIAYHNYLYQTANVLLIAEQPEEAQALLIEATELHFDGSEAPSKQKALYTNLAGVQIRQGNMEAAIANYRKAVALAVEIYPPDHLERARQFSNLGGALAGFGDYQEAERVLREALSIYEKFYQSGVHPRVAAAHNNLGRVLEQAGKLDSARPHLTRAWELAGQLFGEDDPRFAIATGNLGNLYRQLGNQSRAEELLLENLALRKAIFGPEHRAVGSGMSLLAALRLEQDQGADALELCDEALSLFERQQYRNPQVILVTQTRRARALAMLGRTDEARAEFSDILRTGEAVADDLGSVWPKLLAAYAKFHISIGDVGAEPALVLAVDAHQEIMGMTHPATLRVESLLNDWRARTTP